MGIFSKKRSVPLQPKPNGPDQMMGTVHTEREMLYLAELKNAGLDLNAERVVGFAFFAQTPEAARAMVAKIPDNPFTTTIGNMHGRLPFWLITLESQQFKLVPGLAEWSGVFQALHSDAFAYQGWTAIFPEVGPEATADFNIAR